jgi:hypothetical protein
MIFPAVIVGIMSGIGAAFETGIKKALDTYRGEWEVNDMTTLLTGREIEDAKRLSKMSRGERFPEGSGIGLGVILGAILWGIIGFVIYLLCGGR